MAPFPRLRAFFAGSPTNDLARDLRLATRTLRRSPGFAATVVLTLALGIGATTAVFSVVDGVLLRPLPVEDQERLLVVWKSAPQLAFESMPFTYDSYEALRGRLRTVSGLAAHPYYGSSSVVVRTGDGATTIRLAGVTGNWFGVLGARPAAGRLLRPADDRVGAAPVVVLSPAAARRLFGSERGALERTVRIHELAYTVAGIAPAGFEYPGNAEAWVAAAPFFTAVPVQVGSLREATRVAWYLVARVGPEASVAQTRAELASALAGLETEPSWMGGQTIRAPSYADVVVGDVRPALLIVGGGVLLVLLVAGVNVSTLLLVRGVSRQRQLAVRAALGASRRRILRQLSTEALVLAGLGAALGVLVSLGALRFFLALAPPGLPRVSQVGIDARALGFAAALGVITTVVFGVLPGLRTARVELATALGTRTGSGGDRRGHWLRHGLVVGQVALTAVVLSTTGLLLRTLERLQRLEPGFAAEEVVLINVHIPLSRYPAEADHQAGMSELARQVAGLPGVSGASAVLTPPFAGNAGFDAVWHAEGRTSEEAPFANYEGADGAHFETLGLPILQGRPLSEADGEATPRVVVVNETFARLYWPGEDPVGRRLKLGRADSPDPWRTVVGVAADSRYRELAEIRPTVYVPYGQGIPVRPGYLAVRTSLDPAGVTAAVRRLVARAEPSAAVLGGTPLPRLLAEPLARPRFQSALMGMFALLGLVLSIVGTYGVLSFFVRQRTREIGVRVALGAKPMDVWRFVLGHAAAIGGLGVVLGLLGGVAVARVLASEPFGLEGADPVLLGATAAALLLASLAAAAVPTRAATRVDPMIVLRGE